MMPPSALMGELAKRQLVRKATTDDDMLPPSKAEEAAEAEAAEAEAQGTRGGLKREPSDATERGGAGRVGAGAGARGVPMPGCGALMGELAARQQKAKPPPRPPSPDSNDSD